MLDALKLPPEERQSRIDLQKRIQAAVISGTGWEGIPEAMRRQADTPWFKSVLTFDPAQVVPRVKQPILILHAELDPNIPPGEADRLAAIARARKKAAPPEVVKCRASPTHSESQAARRSAHASSPQSPSG